MEQSLNPIAGTAQEAGFLAHIACDMVIFGFDGQQLKILIMEYHNTKLFALPAGFVKINEGLDDAVKRGLHSRTGLSNIYLEQFYTFGSLERHVPKTLRKILINNGNQQISDSHWLLDRFFSIGYYALINYWEVKPEPDSLSDSCEWYDVNNLPELILDHKEIVSKALDTLRSNLDKKLKESNLMPPKFTMNQLQKVYEVILGEKLRRTSFQRRMLGLNILERHEKQYLGKAHKAPFLYSFK
ncbi:MAG: NUDIX hydrolase [Spirosomataceae bacterium]